MEVYYPSIYEKRLLKHIVPFQTAHMLMCICEESCCHHVDAHLRLCVCISILFIKLTYLTYRSMPNSEQKRSPTFPHQQAQCDSSKEKRLLRGRNLGQPSALTGWVDRVSMRVNLAFNRERDQCDLTLLMMQNTIHPDTAYPR